MGRSRPVAHARNTAIDLNKIYAAHQVALFEASRTPDAVRRADLMEEAAEMALRVARNRLRFGTAMACAWSLSDRSLRPDLTPVFG